MSTNSTTHKRWIGRGAWAIADQGLFAIASALLNILLARWLDPVAYGAFAVAYSLLLLLGALHTGIFTEPMLIFGAGKHSHRLPEYLGALIRGHWLLTGATSLILIVVATGFAYFGGSVVSHALFGVALTTPFSLLLWFARRAAYLRRQPHLATIASAVYLLLMTAGLFLIAIALPAVTVFSAMLVTAIAAGVAGLWLVHRLPHGKPTDKSAANISIKAEHWSYGRWAMGTNLLMWVPLNFFFVVLSLWVNLEASATLKALSNLVLPLLQANAALSSLLLPALAARAGSSEAFRKLLAASATTLCSGAILYALVVGAVSKPLIHFLYAGKYDAHAGLLWLLLLIPVLDALIVALASALRSVARPSRVFWAQLSAAVFVMTAGIVASRLYGVTGAGWAMVMGNVLVAVILCGFTLDYLQKQNGVQAVFNLAPPEGALSCQ
ncbi:MAG: hypothetical protein QOD75_3568 [Blastocatellia bacterium]|jgi:O-antigen/teichoic acid export membrane protein|nr:hypothetical protein [Blastocatellia bacterium]